MKTYCPVQVIGQECVYYFHDMIVEFTKWGFQEGKTLFGFGYDFRQSNRYLLRFALFECYLKVQKIDLKVYKWFSPFFPFSNLYALFDIHHG